MYGNAKKYFITAIKKTNLFNLLADNLSINSNIPEIISSGGIWLDKLRLDDPEYVILPKQTIMVYVCPTQGKKYQLKLEQIVFEDENILIINKPSQLTTVPDRSNTKWNLTYGVSQYLRGKSNFYKAGAINRLDFMVQGLVIYAKNKQTEKKLFKLIENREIGKIYLALLEPQEHPPKILRIKDKIGYTNKACADENGKFAHSLFRYKGKFHGYDCYSVVTFTGRRHQIRFHAAKYLRPLIGDGYYGGKVKTKGQAIALLACGYNLILDGTKYRFRLPNVEAIFSELLPQS
ncbi:pseudouridine synthase [Candidatus Margulisiibacteriota bacterium]